jgi:hypothetical protein
MQVQGSDYSQLGSLRALRKARVANELARRKALGCLEGRVANLFSFTTIFTDVVKGLLPEWTRHFASRLFRG